MSQPVAAPAAPAPDTRSWWQRHNPWHYIFGGAAVLAGLSQFVPVVAAASPHAGAVVAIASGLGAVIVSAHKTATQDQPPQP